MVLDSPADGASVNLTVVFKWHVENPNPARTYEFEIALDKGVDPLDGGIEEAFDAGSQDCLSVTLNASRYTNASVEFAIIAIDSQGSKRFSEVRTFQVDADLPPPSCDECPTNQLPDPDGDGAGNACDNCPTDPDKTEPAVCGCGTPDTDSDDDGTPDCVDECPDDPNKTESGVCGCGMPDADCDDGDLCTIDECVDGRCVNTPMECAVGFECDPETGRCAGPPDEFVVGINYPWIKYGLDFGESGFGHVGLSSDGSEGFRPQTFFDSQGITSCEQSDERVHNGSSALKVLTNLQGAHENRTNGEVLVDLQDLATVPEDFAADLDGQTITAWVYVSPGNRGLASRPNFLQLFVKDASEGALGLYGGTTDIPDVGGWVQLSLTVDPASAGFASEGFDPTAVRFVGLKIGIGGQSTVTVSDPIYLDQVESSDPLVQFDFEQSSLAAIDAAQLGAVGVEALRWFILADGRAAPEFDDDNFVTGLDDKFFDDFDALISLARDYNFRIIPVLFDYLLCADSEEVNGVQLFGRKELVRDPARTESFLTNALAPLLDRYGAASEILYWEVINEPEWALADLVSSPRSDITVAEMQAFVRSVADFIHNHETSSETTKVTLGSASDQWADLWTEAGVDVCQFHFYNCEEHPNAGDPCLEYPRTFDFASDCLLGEFATLSSLTDLSVTEYLERAWANGYAGALPWSWRARDEFSPIVEADRVQLLSAISEFQAMRGD